MGLSKVFISDLDRTFLDPNGEVPKGAMEFLNRLRKSGYIVGFASARPLNNVLSQIDGLSFPDWIISNDGAIGYTNENGLFKPKIENYLDNSTKNKIILELRREGFWPILFLGAAYLYKVLVHSSIDAESISAINKSDPTRKIVMYNDVAELCNYEQVRAITLYGDVSNSTANYCFTRYQSVANIMYYKETRFDGGMWLDIISEDAEKYKTAVALSKSIGVGNVDVSLGNGANDLGLIRFSNWSAAPFNADAKIRSYAKYVSDFCEGEKFINDVAFKLKAIKWLA